MDQKSIYNHQQVVHVMVSPIMRLIALMLLATFASAVEKITVTTPTWLFTKDEAWEVWHPDAGAVTPFTIETVTDGLRLTIQPGTSEVRLNLWSDRFKSREVLGAPEALVLDVEVLAGKPILGLDLFDAQAEGIHYADRPLVAGRQSLSWDLTVEKPQHSWGDKRNLTPDAPFGLWGLGIVRAATTTPTVLLLRSMARRESAHPASLVSASLDTGSPIHLLAPGKTPFVVLTSRAPLPISVDLSVSDENWAGAVRSSKSVVTIAANGTLRWPLPEKPTTRGIHWIECTVSDVGDSKPRLTERLPYAIIETPIRKPKPEGFLFGVVGGLPGPGAEGEAYLTKAIDSVSWLGLRYIRTGLNWEYLEKGPGQWDEARLAWFSQGLDRFAAIGTKIQILLCYTTRYAAAKDKQDAQNHLDWMFSPPDLEAWRTYVAKLVSLYGDRVSLWEAWNEADIDFWRGTVEQYQALLKVTREEVKRGDPSRKVMNSGFAFAWPRNGNPIAEIPYRIAKENRDDYDIFAYHLHHTFGEFRSIVEGWLADVRKEGGNPPLLFNECAVNLDVFGERGQAEQLPKKLLFAWSQGAIGFFWYNLTGGERRPSPGFDRNWGLMTEDFHPRAVFCSYHTLTGLLNDATCGGRLPTSKDRYAIRFDTPAGQVIGAWDEDPRASSEPLVVAVGAKATCTYIDLMGVRRPLAADGGVCLMPVGKTPGYLLVTGVGAPITLKPAIVHLEPGLIAIPGRTMEVPIALANPLDKTATVRLSWNLASGFGPVAAQRIELAAGEAKIIKASLPVAAGRSTNLSEVVDLGLDVTIDGTGHKAAVKVPVSKVPALPEGAFNRAADIVLNERISVVNLHENVPQWEKRNWTGSGDLSLQAWFGRQGEHLAVRVVVRDDQHVQTHPAGEAWQGDSLQVAFAMRGGQGSWEFILAREGATGGMLVANGLHPQGIGEASGQTKLITTRVGDLTTYEATWPLSALGLTRDNLRAGIAVNLLVNDDDGEGRDGWIEVAPGIGHQKDASKFPLVSIE